MRYIIFLLMICLLHGCASLEDEREVTGMIVFDPAPSSYDGFVIDLSIYESEGVTIAQKSFTNVEDQPFTFSIAYDGDNVVSNKTYAISATVFEKTENFIFTRYLNKAKPEIISNAVTEDVEIVVESLE